MSAPRVVSVAAASPAQAAGLQVGDALLAIDGRVPRDVIEYRLLVDGADPELEIRRGHEELSVAVDKTAGEALGVEVSSAVFDRVRTCDNHCEFCFIYQLPKGMRKSLYLKDDDYRLSFLYGNFTTLTRFTELDLERVLSEGLSPLFVSIHSTDPELRARMLRNVRGATSLRWLRALLDGGIEVHGQIVVCPGVNDGEALETTLAGVLDEYPELATVACVPLGVSDYTREPAMRAHSRDEADAVIETVEQWQELALGAIGRRLVYAADEYYLLAGRPFPARERYDGFPQHENGIGMARAFACAFGGDERAAIGVKPGFFAWVTGPRPPATAPPGSPPGPPRAPPGGRNRSG
jgi:putative radical SAM enzyme (TIGR03279 family)